MSFHYVLINKSGVKSLKHLSMSVPEWMIYQINEVYPNRVALWQISPYLHPQGLLTGMTSHWAFCRVCSDFWDSFLCWLCCSMAHQNQFYRFSHFIFCFFTYSGFPSLYTFKNKSTATDIHWVLNGVIIQWTHLSYHYSERSFTKNKVMKYWVEKWLCTAGSPTWFLANDPV